MSTRFRRIPPVVLLAALTGFTLPAAAQDAPVSPFRSAIGGFVALSVPDLEASAKWYEAKLGLHRVMEVPRSGTLAGVIALEGDGLLVELIQLDDARPAGVERSELRHGIAKAGILVRDFDATIAVLRARGITFVSGPYPARPGMRANASFRDNNGNYLQVLGPAMAR